MIVAPREIGEGARTGAGAVVTKDIPAGQARRRRPGPDPRAARETNARRGRRIGRAVGTRCR